MLLPLIEVGGFLFWLFIGALVVYEVVCCEYEKKWLSFWGIAAFVLAIWLFSTFSLFGFIFDNWTNVIGIFTGYFIGGVVWTFAKWEFWLSKRRADFEDDKVSWLENRNIVGNKMPDSLKEYWTRHVIINYGTNKFGNSSNIDLTEWTPEKVQSIVEPRVRDNKSRIMYWLAYWPISLFWTLCRDWLAEVWNSIYNAIGKYLQKRAHARFKGVQSDFTVSGSSEKQETSD